MKVIFLDIDGVLNGYNIFTGILCRFFSLFNKNIKDWFYKKIDIFGVHESKVKRLSKIIKKTGAKVVMSSSWRFGFFDKPYENMPEDFKKLYDLFEKYDIEIIDITPKSKDGERYREILSWLSRNEEKVDKFVILDDERFDLECFVDSKLVLTSSVEKGQMICGAWNENTGLKNKHVRKAIEILNT